MDFQEKMIEYAKYGISVRTSSNEGVDYYMVTLTFGNKWKVMEPVEYPEQKVWCAKVGGNGTYCYMAQVANGITPIFEMIDDTIRYNEEMERKVDLLKVKAEELKDLFAEKTYEELMFLKFVIEKPQEPVGQKSKRQPKSGKKTAQKPNTGVTEYVSGELKGVDEEFVVDSVTKEVSSVDNEPSEIDRKIAEAIGNKI